VTELLVVGAGLAGVAACVRATELGVKPLLISEGIGASQMMSGAADGTDLLASAKRGDEEVRWCSRFLAQLGWSELGNFQVASAAGIIRETHAVGPGVLRLSAERGSQTLVVAGVCEGFDSLSLARALADQPWTKEYGARFRGLSNESFFSEQELRLPLPAFVSLLDQGERARLFLDALERHVSEDVDAVLVGPWLPQSLTSRLRVPLGSVLSPPDGAAARSFEERRAPLLSSLDLFITPGQVGSVVLDEGTVNFEWRSETDGLMKARAKRAVVATGGLVGGGVRPRPEREVGFAWSRIVAPPRLSGDGALEGWDPAERPVEWLVGASSKESARGPLRIVGDARVSPSGIPGSSGVIDAILSAKLAVDSLFECIPS